MITVWPMEKMEGPNSWELSVQTSMWFVALKDCSDDITWGKCSCEQMAANQRLQILCTYTQECIPLFYFVAIQVQVTVTLLLKSNLHHNIDLRWSDLSLI
jgi:hypothetical protein